MRFGLAHEVIAAGASTWIGELLVKRRCRWLACRLPMTTRASAHPLLLPGRERMEGERQQGRGFEQQEIGGLIRGLSSGREADECNFLP